MKLDETQMFFGALADATRLRVVNLLAEGELCVCDLMQVLKVPQSKISRHLAYLRRARIVSARKEALWMYYRLAEPQSRTAGAVLKALAAGSEEFDELKKDRSEFRKNKKRLVACCD